MEKKRILTAEQVRLVLVEKYGCKYLGPPVPPPYIATDEMPVAYEAPSGYRFYIPADDGCGYGPETFDAILRAAKLDVVIDLPAARREKEA